jgi:hypothetical protein
MAALLGSLSFSLAPRAAETPPAPAAPDVFASPINAGCVHVTPSTCRLHVDPFTIAVASGQHLVAFQLRANGALLYDFRTDVSNPPTGNYTPTLPKKDFAARCGSTYTVNLQARDLGDAGFLNTGQAQNIVCPVGTFTSYLPTISR